MPIILAETENYRNYLRFGGLGRRNKKEEGGGKIEDGGNTE